MNRILTFITIAFLLSGCQSLTFSTFDSDNNSCIESIAPTYNSVLSDPNKGWSECFDHYSEGLFESVTNQIEHLAKQPANSSEQLDTLLYYLRAYSYYARLDELTESQWQQLDSAIEAVVDSNVFNSQARIQEHILVTWYNFYGHKNAGDRLTKFIPQLNKLVQELSTHSSLTASQQEYTNWEVYRAVGFLAYEARGNKTVKSLLVDSKKGELPELATSLLTHSQKLSNNNWQLQNSLWALANLHRIMNADQQKMLDAQVDELVFSASYLNQEQQKQLYSQVYLVNSFRYNEQCDTDFKGKCSIPTIDDVLPINHTCSDTLFIRAGSMTNEQLNNACKQLTAQESFFHDSVGTELTPVANDLNTSLRVIIFNNYSEYNRWGQLLFNINTENGGMYIEGTPEQQGNQATFYSFEAFWQQPDFAVWNLNHEYVHYLDGRFVKYGTFGHYPSHLVWWSEGIAEYVSKQKQNNRSLNLLNSTKEEEWPTLEKIFSTAYGDGQALIYKWSYQGVRFLFENHPTIAKQLAKYLKQDDFDNYLSLLTETAKSKQDEFKLWQQTHRPKKESSKAKVTMKKHTVWPIYRYLYRTYLIPEHLPNTGKHKHFENWGGN